MADGPEFTPDEAPIATASPKSLEQSFSREAQFEQYDPTTMDTPVGQVIEDVRRTDGGELAASSMADMDYMRDSISGLDAPAEVDSPDISQIDPVPVEQYRGDLSKPIAPHKPTFAERRAARRADAGAAQRARMEMNRAKVAAFAEDDHVMERPPVAGMKHEDFEAVTFPSQDASNENVSARWAGFHQAGNDFRDGLLDHLQTETLYILQHSQRLRQITEKLMRERY